VNLTFHKGIVLDVSQEGWDSGAATFGTVIYSQDDHKYYLFYTGSSDTGWTEASIGLAISQDGLSFRKNDLNPVINSKDFGLKEALTPVVFRIKNNYFMVFAGKEPRAGRKIYIAYSDDPVGPWRFIKQLIRPQYPWEGKDIDLGLSAFRLGENEILIYYSNVSNKLLRSLLFGPRYWFRTLGILKLRVNSPTDIEVYRFEGNPLRHLNGPRGSWNESLFCPGHFIARSSHYLVPAASTYSIGFPYKQYIGLIKDSSPYFMNPTRVEILIDGPREKQKIIPGIKSEIALDVPCPIIRNGELWLYYSAMDRADGVWKTALSIIPLEYLI
jgi:hypothetical protein